MAYYTYIAGIDSVTITVYGISFGQRLRFFLRRSTSTATDQDFVLEASCDPFETTLYGLSGNTEYTVNVTKGCLPRISHRNFLFPAQNTPKAGNSIL